LHWSGYLQAQYQHDASSQDELSPDGQSLNRDQFALRRGRLRVTADAAVTTAQALQGLMEFDGSTHRGPQATIRRAQLGWRWQPTSSRQPVLAVTAGLTSIPFGSELRTAPDRLGFLERSAGSQAWFSGPVDTGLRVHGPIGWFHYDLAVMAGAPLDDRAAQPKTDELAAVEWVGRLGLQADSGDVWHVDAGLSWLSGKGLSHGRLASKAQLAWQDFNDNGSLDTGELVALPALAQRPSQVFERWAVGVDVSAVLRTLVGQTTVAIEAAAGSNMDRGLWVADPVATGLDQRSTIAVVSLLQRLPWPVTLGVRASWYRPDLDLLDARRGVLEPLGQRFDVFAPQITWHMHPDAELRLEYERIDDRLGRDAVGRPVDLANDRATVRAQLRF
jgi:hypothetical protein